MADHCGGLSVQLCMQKSLLHLAETFAACGISALELHRAQLFPDTSLVKASAPESRSATQVVPLEISERSGNRHAAASSKL